MTLQAEALDGFVIDGVEHNIPFLAALMQHPRWREGQLSTGFIAEEFKGGFRPRPLAGEDLEVLAAVAVAIDHLGNARRREITDQMGGPACVSPGAGSSSSTPSALRRRSKEAWWGHQGERPGCERCRQQISNLPPTGGRASRFGRARWRGPRVRAGARHSQWLRLAYRGVRAKAYVYTEREAALADADAAEACPRYLQAADLPDAGPGQKRSTSPQARR